MREKERDRSFIIITFVIHCELLVVGTVLDSCGITWQNWKKKRADKKAIWDENFFFTIFFVIFYAIFGIDNTGTCWAFIPFVIMILKYIFACA